MLRSESFRLNLAIVGVLFAAVLLAACSALYQFGVIGQLRSESFSTDVADAETAEISIRAEAQSITIGPVDDDALLVAGSAVVSGELVFDVSGGDVRRVELEEVAAVLDSESGAARVWSVGLTRAVPVTFDFDLASGTADLNLASLALNSLALQVTSGHINGTLPPSEAGYPIDLDVTSGVAELALPDDLTTEINLTLLSGNVQMAFGERTNAQIDAHLTRGSAELNIPGGAGVRVEIIERAGGGLSLPDDYVNVDADAWESPDYADAEHRIIIRLHADSGSLTIR